MSSRSSRSAPSSPYASQNNRNRGPRGAVEYPYFRQNASPDSGTNDQTAQARSHSGGAGAAYSQSMKAAGRSSTYTVLTGARSLWHTTPSRGAPARNCHWASGSGTNPATASWNRRISRATSASTGSLCNTARRA